MRPAGRRHGRSFINGCGTSGWNWDISFIQIHCAPPRRAPACPLAQEETVDTLSPRQGYGPPDVALLWKRGRFSGRDFAPQPDGTLRCPAGQTLRAHERRKEGDGSLRVVYGASIHSCRSCPLREQCQWNGKATNKPRQVSVLLHPLVIGSAPLRLRVTGAGDSIDAPVCSLCVINTSR